MKIDDKQIKTAETVGTEKGETTFTFPHSPQPIVIKAKSIAEAEKKFEDIIKQPNSQE